MDIELTLPRRSVLLGAAASLAGGVLSCLPVDASVPPSLRWYPPLWTVPRESAVSLAG